MVPDKSDTARVRLRRTIRCVAALVVGCFASSAVFAQYPDRPIRLVIPSVPGGGTDLTWRMIEPGLSAILGQRLIVDNRGGAGGDIGAGIVAQASPDGYTLLGGVSSITINPAFKKDMAYNLLRDLAPVSLAVKAPNFLLSHPGVPAKTVQQLIAHIKAQPKPLQFASAGLGSMPHLMMELFLSMTRLELIHIPYKGTGQVLADVIGGQVPLMMGNLLPVLPHVTGGRLRAYAVTSATRSSAAPDIPTLAEAGVPGYEAVQWFGMWTRAGTPRAAVEKLHRSLSQVLGDAAFRKGMADRGADVSPSASPAAYGEFVRGEMKKWAKVIKDARLEMK